MSSLPLTDKTIDLIAIGRSSVDLYGEQIGGRLEDMGSFAKYVGGSPTNTAIAAARLGLKAGLLTRVGADHMGRFIREELVREGVDVRGVHTDPARLTALVVLGIRNRESFPLIFYRENCADMALCEQDLDDAYLASARAVLINGTHLSAPGVFAASLSAARRVKASGGRVVFDVDYRPVLWGLTAKDLGENRFVFDAGGNRTPAGGAALVRLDRRHGRGALHFGGIGTADRRHPKYQSENDGEPWFANAARGAASPLPSDIPDDIESGLVVPGFKINVSMCWARATPSWAVSTRLAAR